MFPWMKPLNNLQLSMAEHFSSCEHIHTSGTVQALPQIYSLPSLQQSLTAATLNTDPPQPVQHIIMPPPHPETRAGISDTCLANITEDSLRPAFLQPLSHPALVLLSRALISPSLHLHPPPPRSFSPSSGGPKA